MVRKKIRENLNNSGFKLRGVGATRIEALSDGVFAIAIALLLISASFPETYAELRIFMYDFIPFGMTIALLILIWYQHYVFFQRYGLQDAKTVAINTILLFLILFYVYPLKFLFKTLYSMFKGLFTGDNAHLEKLFTETIPIEDAPSLMVIYGLGGMLIFLTLAGMYFRAWVLRDQLDLSELERFDTKASINMNLAQAIIPFASVLIAYFGLGGDRNAFAFSGLAYWLYPVVMPILGTVSGKRRKKILDMITDEEVDEESP